MLGGGISTFLLGIYDPTRLILLFIVFQIIDTHLISCFQSLTGNSIALDATNCYLFILNNVRRFCFMSLSIRLYSFKNHCDIQMIRFILLQNRRGRTRLSKWFINYDQNQKIRLQSQIHRMIVGRDSKQTDFIQFHNFKIVYKRYQGLYFAVCIDINDNELLHLEVIHLFVQNLDQYFGNVCELDIVFNFHKVYGILDEIIVGGEVLETAKDIIVNSLKQLQVED